MAYTNVITGSAVQPTPISYAAVALTASITLSWPFTYLDNTQVVANQMDVTPSAGGFVITMPAANESGTGQVTIMRNLGASSFTVNDNAGNLIVTIAASQIFYLYITDNTSVAGVWRTVQFGTGTSSADAAALEGLGLLASGGVLNTATPVTAVSVTRAFTSADRAGLFVWTAGTGNFTLPDASSVGDNFYFSATNQGTGILNIVPNGTQTIDTSFTIVDPLELEPQNSCSIVSDGTQWWTMGLNQPATYEITILNLDVSGNTNVTLTTNQANNLIQNYSGVLTGNINVYVPTTAAQYYVYNNTTGAFTLTVKTLAGTGVTVTQGTRSILYCDGVNINATPTDISTTLTLPLGTVSAPSLSFVSDSNTGIYSPGANQLSITSNGTALLAVNTTSVNSIGTLQQGGVDVLAMALIAG